MAFGMEGHRIDNFCNPHSIEGHIFGSHNSKGIQVNHIVYRGIGRQSPTCKVSKLVTLTIHNLTYAVRGRQGLNPFDGDGAVLGDTLRLFGNALRRENTGGNIEGNLEGRIPNGIDRRRSICNTQVYVRFGSVSRQRPSGKRLAAKSRGPDFIGRNLLTAGAVLYGRSTGSKRTAIGIKDNLVSIGTMTVKD